MRRSIALILAAAGLTACAPISTSAPDAAAATPRSGPRQCFDPARITNFARGEPGTLYVRALNGDVYSLVGGGCPDAGAGMSISITPAIGIGSQLCVGEDAQIVTPASNFGPTRCRARIQAALTPAEVEALPSRYRP
ncbi:hypothetical protein [Brevundimonas sp.]